MEDKPGLDLVQRHIGTIQTIWRGVRASDPTADDLVCILKQQGDQVQFKLGPRADYVAQLERHHRPTGDLVALKLPAGDALPKFPRSMALWIVVPTQQGIGLLRITDEDPSMPKYTSPGGDC